MRLGSAGRIPTWSYALLCGIPPGIMIVILKKIETLHSLLYKYIGPCGILGGLGIRVNYRSRNTRLYALHLKPETKTLF